MAKREIPLFIIDTAHWHNQGDADFVVCTDQDSGFIARVDIVGADQPDTVTDTIRIGHENRGYKMRMEIKRITGKNPSPSAIRTLMKKACDYYAENKRTPIHSDEPSTLECVRFLNLLIDGNRQNLQDSGGDFTRRKTVETSLKMLEAIRLKLLE
ncbi:hypothetical protein [uncultured Bacteroides sp.]|uniref:hypothetical protein n=1 Tax=uncultured Bacteroides sp. TaxID=162156 RepID=UPI00260BADE8|nr:hypothetical protein [uncultured Bacteroides sp.]